MCVCVCGGGGGGVSNMGTGHRFDISLCSLDRIFFPFLD